MDKKSFDIVLDEIRKCVLTDQRVKAIEQVHGYFSSEQVIDILKYFSWAEPQIKAVKALQHKMVAVPTTKVANILNCFTFTKDKLVVLELLALNISDAQNYRPVEDLFRTHLSEKKRARRILEQVCKVGCKAPVAMISSCGVIPGNPYPKGRPSQVTGSFPKAPLPMPTNNNPATATPAATPNAAKKETEESSNEPKGIAARILGPFKPSPSSYNPHRPVPYPIPPCRVHATIAPSYSRASSQQSSSVTTTTTASPHTPTPTSSTPAAAASSSSSTTPAPTTPITPIFPGMVPSQHRVAQSPTPAPAPSPSSVIKGPPMSPHLPSTPGAGSHPPASPFSGAPPGGMVVNNKSHTPTPSGTPGPPGSFSPSPFQGRTSRAGTPLAGPPPTTPTLTPRGGAGSNPSADPSAMMGGGGGKSYPSPVDAGMMGPSYPGGGGQPGANHSVIRSYTPTGLPDRSTPLHMPHGGPGSAPPTHSPKPSSQQQAAAAAALGPGAMAAFFGSGDQQHPSALPHQRGSSGGSSPIPSAFKGPSSRSGTPSLSSLAMPMSNSAALARSLGLPGHHPVATSSPQSSVPSSAMVPGLSAMHSALAASQQAAGASPVPQPSHHFPGLPSYPSGLSSSSPFPAVPSSIPSSAGHPMPSSSVYSGLPPSAAQAAAAAAAAGSPFGLGLTTAPSIFSGLPPGHSPQAFSGFGASGPQGVGSPVLSSLMGSSVATVAPLQAAAVAAAGVPSTSPVLPGFASAFSSNYNPALVGQPGLTSGLQAPGGGSFPGLLSFPGMGGFSPSPSQAALAGLHNPMQSALLQAHSASPLESYPPQPNGFGNYPPAPGTPFPLQPGLHPQLWQ
ncbi:proline and serine-rich protein 1 isoform X2 [Engraulis encrasicolus]|uniref:proline and serine-rich protein 1 isoform X2 n=1 Tax=Engraulis encrasicolus TaxID=184585 RepID=UPI002FD27A7A